jgi:hypothetical protein
MVAAFPVLRLVAPSSLSLALLRRVSAERLNGRVRCDRGAPHEAEAIEVGGTSRGSVVFSRLPKASRQALRRFVGCLVSFPLLEPVVFVVCRLSPGAVCFRFSYLYAWPVVTQRMTGIPPQVGVEAARGCEARRYPEPGAIDYPFAVADVPGWYSGATEKLNKRHQLTSGNRWEEPLADPSCLLASCPFPKRQRVAHADDVTPRVSLQLQGAPCDNFV